MKILFLVYKYIPGTRELSEFEQNFIGSVPSGLAQAEVCYLDKIAPGELNAELVKKTAEASPDMIFFCAPHPELINKKTWEFLAGFNVVMMWADLQSPASLEESKKYLPYVKFHIGGCYVSAARASNPKYLFMWVPKDPRYFNNPGLTRDIDISFLGTTRGKKDRLRAINALKKAGLNVLVGGGEREEHLTNEKYCEILQRSKIVLNSARAGFFLQLITARVYEAMQCGAMLLERENYETPRLFAANKEYISWSSTRDLVEKAKYYLSHEAQRQAVALAGERAMREKYSAEKFWKVVLDCVHSGVVGNQLQYHKLDVKQGLQSYFDSQAWSFNLMWPFRVCLWWLNRLDRLPGFIKKKYFLKTV